MLGRVLSSAATRAPDARAGSSRRSTGRQRSFQPSSRTSRTGPDRAGQAGQRLARIAGQDGHCVAYPGLLQVCPGCFGFLAVQFGGHDVTGAVVGHRSSKVDGGDAERRAEHFTIPGHGDLSRDLRDYLGQLAVFLTSTDAGAVFRALAGQAQHDPAVAARFQAQVLAPQRERDRAPFLAAINRGQLAACTDIDLAVDQVAGPVYYRVLITGQSVTAPFTNALVDCYLAGLTRPAGATVTDTPKFPDAAGTG
jgi:Tetracyclin repressor-like, C-terminal domain